MNWEQLANDRPSGRVAILTGVAHSEQQRKEHSERLCMARNKMPAQFQPLLKSCVQSVAVFGLPELDCIVTSELMSTDLISFNSISVKWTSYSL